MKKNILIVFLLGILLFPVIVKAYTIKIVDDNSFTISEKEDYLFEVELNDTELEESSTYLYIVKSSKETLPNSLLNDINNKRYKCKSNSYEKCLLETNEDLSFTLEEEWFESDKLYAYVLLVNKDEVVYIEKPIKIDKPIEEENDYEANEIYSFKNEVVGNFIKKNNYLYITPQSKLNSETIKVKIGIIHSLDLLDELRYKDEKAYDDLIKYAKNDKNGYYVELDLQDNSKIYRADIRRVNVMTGAYYYLYVEENETAPEGIMFGQGRFRLLESDIIWPNKTLLTIGLIIFIIYMTIPIGCIVYIVIMSKKR